MYTTLSRPLTDVDTTPVYQLGSRHRTKDNKEYIYLKGVTSNAQYAVCFFSEGTYTASLVATTNKGRVGVSQGAIDGSSYGWFQTVGRGIAKCDAGIVSGAQLYIDGTAGRCDDTVVSGDQIQGMTAAGTDSSNLVAVDLNNPIVNV